MNYKSSTFCRETTNNSVAASLQKKSKATIHIDDNRNITALQLMLMDRLGGASEQLPVQRVEEEDLLQGKFADAQTPVQRQKNEADDENGLPNQLKAGLESLSGMDMSNVRVHKNSNKPAQLNAHAYAQGNDIHLSSGQEQHLPHEAWHVVQQRQGRVKPTMTVEGVAVNDNVSLEKEADSMGARALDLG